MTPAQQRYRRAVARKHLADEVAHLLRDATTLGTVLFGHVESEYLAAARELVAAHGSDVLAEIGAGKSGAGGLMLDILQDKLVESFARAIDAHLGKARPAPVGCTHLFAVCVDGQPGMVCTSSEEAHEFVRWSKLGDRAEVWPVEATGSLVRALANAGGEQC